MKRLALILIIIFAVAKVFAQNLPVRDFRIARDIEMSANDKLSTTHSSIKPYRNSATTERNDTISQFDDFVGYKLKNNNVYLNILPAYELSGGANIGTQKNFRLCETLGFIVDFSLKDKLNVAYMQTETYGFNKNNQSVFSEYNFDNLWGMYSDRRFRNGFFVEQTFNINYTPVEFFSVEIGNGKHFYGDGYRSLLQSDICDNYPYLKIESEFLNFKYSCVWSVLNYIDNYRQFGNPEFENTATFGKNHKYNVTHYLDCRIGKHVNLSLFESVMSENFLAFEYFNPVIFFRPVEFSMGSNENALMGANLKISFSRKNCIYGQVVLDDIIVGQLKNDIKHNLLSSYTGEYGWFANKWGLQGGIKFFDIFKVKNLDCFVEGNIVRPYTYSHSNSSLTYTHNNKPLAHPLGANFVEGVGGISYFNDRFECGLVLEYAVVGCDSSYNSHFGQNVFYATMDAYMPSENNIPVSSYYNVLLQGVSTKIATAKIKFAYYPLKNKALSVFAEIIFRKNANELRSDNFCGFYLGVKSRLLR